MSALQPGTDLPNAGAYVPASQGAHRRANGRAPWRLPEGGDTTLGTSAKSVAQDVDRGAFDRRALRFRLQAVARSLMPQERVAHCLHTPAGSAVVVAQSADGRAHLGGLQTCGSVWHCPVCSARVTNVRRDELNDLLRWGRRQPGVFPVMVTLTTRHGSRQPLRGLLGRIKAAKKKLHQRRPWRDVIAPSLAGHVTATEVTYGQNGWHPHFHMLLLVRARSEREAMQRIEGARSAWEDALRDVGLSCNEHGFQVQGAADAADYVAKWGAAEELTLTRSKLSRSEKGATMWELLELAGHGDCDAADRWREYARAFKGGRQLVWSRGLKAAIGLTERSDDEIAAENEPDSVAIAILPAEEWRLIARSGLRLVLLEAVEAGGAAAIPGVLAAARARSASAASQTQ